MSVGSELKYILILINGLFFLTNCTNVEKDTEVNSLVKAKFTVNDDLLADKAFIDSSMGISILPPKGWISQKAFEQNEMSVLVNRLAGVVDLVMFYIDMQDTSIMAIRSIDKTDRPLIDSLRTNYKELLNSDGRWADVQYKRFNHGCFDLDQYVFQNSEFVFFKIFGTPSEGIPIKSSTFEIVFFLKRSNAENKMRILESSLGSLNCIF